MEFRRRKVRGASQKVKKLWMDQKKRYQIRWRREAYGVALRPAFFALVHCVFSREKPDQLCWDFCGARRVYKTFKAAVEAVEAHEKIWNAVLALNHEKAFITRLKDLQTRASAGAGTFAHNMLASLPMWAVRAIRPQILDWLYPSNLSDEREEVVLCTTADASSEPNPSGPTNHSKTSETSTGEAEEASQSTGPVSDAEETGRSTTRKTRQTRLKATDTVANSPAPTAEEAGKGQKKRASKPTEPQTPTSKRKAVSTKHSSKRGAKRSKPSPKSKSKRSAS